MVRFLDTLIRLGQIYIGWFLLCVIGFAIVLYRETKHYDEEINNEKEEEDDE